MTLPFTRAAWRPLCSAAVLGETVGRHLRLGRCR
ncbi:hypothetical protein, partial [Pseudomonas aeruginosa]